MMEIQVGALIFTGMGLLFLLIGIFLMKVFGRRRKTASMVTTARVVDVKCRRDSGGSTYYYPVFEYYAGGRMQRVVSTFGSSPCRYQTGMPEGFCPWAWVDLYAAISRRAIDRAPREAGKEYWYKHENKTIECCTDGVRPVIFLLEAVPEEE